MTNRYAMSQDFIEMIEVQAFENVPEVAECQHDVRVARLWYIPELRVYVAHLCHNKGDLGEYIVRHNEITDYFTFEYDPVNIRFDYYHAFCGGMTSKGEFVRGD